MPAELKKDGVRIALMLVASKPQLTLTVEVPTL